MSDNKHQTLSIENILITTPRDCWQAWIRAIATDPDMSADRALVHLKNHVGGHLNPNRFVEWLAGCYNLLAILGCIQGIDPQYLVGVDLLYRKWLSNPNNYTPPPVGKTKKAKRTKTGSGSNELSGS